MSYLDRLESELRRIREDLSAALPGVEINWSPVWDQSGVLVVAWNGGLEEIGITLSGQVEPDLVSIAAALQDSAFFDDDPDPWPRCPIHGTHSLQPSLKASQGFWACPTDGAPVVTIGKLASL